MFFFGPITSFLHLSSWLLSQFSLVCYTLKSSPHSFLVVLFHLVTGIDVILFIAVLLAAIVIEDNYLSIDNNTLFSSYILCPWNASSRGSLKSNTAVTVSPIIGMLLFHLEDLKLFFLVKVKMLILPVSLALVQQLGCSFLYKCKW